MHTHYIFQVGAITWVAPYAPHFSTFLPIYANGNYTPAAIGKVTATQYKIDKGSNYWIHSLTANYVSRWYKHTINDTVHHQQALERDIFAKQAVLEADVVSMLQSVETTLNDIAAGSTKMTEDVRQHAIDVKQKVYYN